MTLCHLLVMTKAIFSAINDFSLDNIDSEAELIPLMTSEDEEALEKRNYPKLSSASNKKYCIIPRCCYSNYSW